MPEALPAPSPPANPYDTTAFVGIDLPSCMEWGEFAGAPVLSFWKPHSEANYDTGVRYAQEVAAFARAQNRHNLIAIVCEEVFDGKYLGGRPICEAARGFLNKMSRMSCVGALD